MPTYSTKFRCDFNFKLSLLSHGWVFLSPFVLGDERSSVSRTDILPTGRKAFYTVCIRDGVFSIDTDFKLADIEVESIEKLVIYMFRLDEDFSLFHKACLNSKHLCFAYRLKAGRLLRGASLFEDFVKTLCTTNSSWPNTKRMVSNIVKLIGGGAFPTAQMIISFGKDKLCSNIGIGYRANYLLSLCERIASGDDSLSYENLKANDSTEASKIIKSIKGFGVYATNHMLMILGKYDSIPIDSEVKAYFEKIYNIENVNNDHINQIYNKWGDWKYLAYKMERIGTSMNYIDNAFSFPTAFPSVRN